MIIRLGSPTDANALAALIQSFQPVLTTRHREGIARTLWHRAREAALQSGNPGEFTVNSSMVAVPVYRSFGFVQDGAVVLTHGMAFQAMRLKVRDDA